MFSKTSPRARVSGPLVLRATQVPHPERNHPNAPEEGEQALYRHTTSPVLPPEPTQNRKWSNIGGKIHWVRQTYI